tara:strand:+ start:1670 stop:2092 length:423 start_codon:yes stop_codon:yes gene_type:complete
MSVSLSNIKNLFKNDYLTNFILFLSIALSVGYLVNKTYHALVLLYVIAALMFLLCKNIACALGISIILTNLFLSLNMIDVKENFKEGNLKGKGNKGINKNKNPHKIKHIILDDKIEDIQNDIDALQKNNSSEPSIERVKP